MLVKIRGSSDDLIEIEGDIQDEFSGYGRESFKLAFSDGTVLEVRYTEDGLWKISRIFKGSAEYSLVFEATNSDSKHYSDIAELNGDIKWVGLLEELTK